MKRLNKDKLRTNLEKRACDDIANCNISAQSVCVSQNGETVYKNCFGVSHIKTGEPLREDAVFRLASMTKPVTAAAALILLSEGKIGLDDEIEKYLPDYNDMHIASVDENGVLHDEGLSKTKPTIKHLLTHCSGIATDEVGLAQQKLMTKEDRLTLKSSVDYFSKQGLCFEPFTKSSYSPLFAFDVCARIVEIASGMDFEEFLKKNIFEPCEMNDTAFKLNKDQWSRMVGMHNQMDGKNAEMKRPDGCVFEVYQQEHYMGGAGLASTLGDYVNFAEMLLNDGNFKGRKVIEPEYVKMMRTPQLPDSVQSGSEKWGLGVRVITDESYGRLPVGSFGWSGAYGTHFWVDPVNRVTAVYMKNSMMFGGAGSMTAVNFEQDVHDSFED